MKTKSPGKLKDGDHCNVVGGTHAGKSGTVRDIHTSKTGHITITVVQKTVRGLRLSQRMLKFRHAAMLDNGKYWLISKRRNICAV